MENIQSFEQYNESMLNESFKSWMDKNFSNLTKFFDEVGEKTSNRLKKIDRKKAIDKINDFADKVERTTRDRDKLNLIKSLTTLGLWGSIIYSVWELIHFSFGGALLGMQIALFLFILKKIVIFLRNRADGKKLSDYFTGKYKK